MRPKILEFALEGERPQIVHISDGVVLAENETAKFRGPDGLMINMVAWKEVEGRRVQLLPEGGWFFKSTPKLRNKSQEIPVFSWTEAVVNVELQDFLPAIREGRFFLETEVQTEDLIPEQQEPEPGKVVEVQQIHIPPAPRVEVTSARFTSNKFANFNLPDPMLLVDEDEGELEDDEEGVWLGGVDRLRSEYLALDVQYDLQAPRYGVTPVSVEYHLTDQILKELNVLGTETPTVDFIFVDPQLFVVLAEEADLQLDARVKSKICVPRTLDFTLIEEKDKEKNEVLSRRRLRVVSIRTVVRGIGGHEI